MQITRELDNGTHNAMVAERAVNIKNKSTGEHITLIVKDDQERERLLDVIFNRD